MHQTIQKLLGPQERFMIAASALAIGFVAIVTLALISGASS
jgi:hypothetical protein